MIGKNTGEEVDYSGLWRKSKKLCMLEVGGLGTNEIEKDSLKRTWNRMVKNRFQGSIKKMERSSQYKRDIQYVKGLLKLRKEQAREDWESARAEYRKEKESLRRRCQNESQVNRFKREMKKMSDHYNEVYKDGKKNQQDKITRLESRHCKGCKEMSNESREQMRDKWVCRIAAGTGNPRGNETDTPVYGNVTLDQDEKAYINMAPKYCLYKKLEIEESLYDRTLCNTKLRWGRRQTGSPEEQEQEAVLNIEKGEPPPDPGKALIPGLKYCF